MCEHDPDNYTEQQSGLDPKRNTAEAAFAEWIKTDIIAEIIFESLQRAGIDPTFENAKIVYLDILEQAFYDAIESCIDHNPAFANAEPVPDPVES